MMPDTKPGRSLMFILMLLLWILTAWLLYPLVVLETVDMTNARAYLYRSALGIAFMLIFFGKSLFDLFFPSVTSTKTSRTNTGLLALYTIALAGGIIFMFVRIILLYLKSRGSPLPF